MTTKNIRIVGYLPPPYHPKLRQYAQTHSLSESAALVRIVQQFFDRPAPPDDPSTRLERELAAVKEEMARMQQRLGILEAALLARTPPRNSPPSRNSASRHHRTPILPAQTPANLARRLGVTVENLEEARGKGEEYFKNWSKRRDPGSRAWVERDGRFHPL